MAQADAEGWARRNGNLRITPFTPAARRGVVIAQAEVQIGGSPGDHFDLIARQISCSTKNVAADELTWFAIEVVE